MEDTIEKPLVFDFAKYTEVTDLAFICQDVNDYWLVRILKGYNEDYEKDEDSSLMERDKIAKNHKSDRLTLSKTRAILKKDKFENWNVLDKERYICYNDKRRYLTDTSIKNKGTKQ